MLCDWLYVHGRRSRDVVSDAALERLQSAERQSGAFAVVMPLLERALARANERIYEADPDNRRALNDRLREEIRLLRGQWADLVNLRTHAIRVVSRALDESTWHSEECPFTKAICVSQEDKTWHMSWSCSAEKFHTEAHRFIPCRICACEWHTPCVPNDRTGVSWHTDLEHFLEESAQLDFETEEEEEEDHLTRVRRYQNIPLAEASGPEFWQQVNQSP